MLGASDKRMDEKMDGFRQYFWTYQSPGMWRHVIAQAVPDISKDQSAFTVLWSVHVMPCHQTCSSWYFKEPECHHTVGKCSCDAVSSDMQFLIFQRTRVPSHCREVFIQWHSVTSQETRILMEGTVSYLELSQIRNQLYAVHDDQDNWPPAWVRADQVTTAHHPLARFCL